LVELLTTIVYIQQLLNKHLVAATLKQFITISLKVSQISVTIHILENCLYSSQYQHILTGKS